MVTLIAMFLVVTISLTEAVEDVNDWIVPVVLLRVAIVPVVLLRVAIVPDVKIPDVLVVVPTVRAVVIVPEVNTPEVPVVVPIVALLDAKVGIVPVVIVAAVDVVVPNVPTPIVPVVATRFVIVPLVLLNVAVVPLVTICAVEVVVPVVRLSTVPDVLTSGAFRKLATVICFRLLESEASPISNVSFVAIMLSTVRSWIKPGVGVALVTSVPSLAAVTSFATPSEKVVPALNDAIVFSPNSLSDF